jgi:hypothetical protein
MSGTCGESMSCTSRTGPASRWIDMAALRLVSVERVRLPVHLIDVGRLLLCNLCERADANARQIRVHCSNLCRYLEMFLKKIVPCSLDDCGLWAKLPQPPCFWIT